MNDARVIKNYDMDNVTNEFLYSSHDWDLVELNYSLDADKLSAWYQEIYQEFMFMRFAFNDNPQKLDLEKSAELVSRGHCGIYCGPIDGLTLAWPTERYEPLPPPVQCNPEVFPEVNYETFFDDAKLLKRFVKGYFAEMIDVLGEDSFHQAIIATHHDGMFIRPHVDSNVLKLHIPVETHPGSLFHFGPNNERSYHMKLGKIYLLNTKAWHGTTNNGGKRSHIITRVADSHLQTILGLTNEALHTGV